MFIENPNKKESYSFRVKPDLLEKIKNYAKATKQTVPEILNDMIEEKVDGLHLTNDYLENTIDSTNIIGLPPLMDIYNNGQYKEFGLFFENNNRVFYEVKKIPNNIDIWTDTEGYTSKKRGVDHEGISFVLAPELITNPEYLETPELLFCCLVPVYFRVSIKKKSIQAKNISFNDALEKIRNSPNIELMDTFTANTTALKEIILKYSNSLNNASENPDGTYYSRGFIYSNKTELLNGLYSKLLMDLEVLATEINTDIVSHINEAVKRANTPEDRLKNTDISMYSQFDTIELLHRIDELKKENEELKTENKTIKKDMDNINNTLENINNKLIEIENRPIDKKEILSHFGKG